MSGADNAEVVRVTLDWWQCITLGGRRDHAVIAYEVAAVARIEGEVSPATTACSELVAHLERRQSDSVA